MFQERIDKNGIVKDEWSRLINTSMELPIYIYGAGNLADNILKKLLEFGIILTGVITDTGEETFHGYSNEEFSVFVEKEIECKIIIGFAAGFSKEVQRKLAKYKFLHVFEIANPFDHHAHFSMDFVNEKMEQLKRAYDCFADEESKQNYCALINARVYENADYVRAVFKTPFGEFENELLPKNQEEVFVDVGAYQGGSILRYLKAREGDYKKIIAIEPEKHNFEMLEKFCRDNNVEAKCIQIGCWKEPAVLYFNDEDDKCCRIEENGKNSINVDSLDNILAGENSIDILNVGISTAEVEILQGAEKIIKQFHPKMLVFMGSAKEELYLVPRLIKGMDPSYKLYLRFIQPMPSRVFLYAV